MEELPDRVVASAGSLPKRWSVPCRRAPVIMYKHVWVNFHAHDFHITCCDARTAHRFVSSELKIPRPRGQRPSGNPQTMQFLMQWYHVSKKLSNKGTGASYVVSLHTADRCVLKIGRWVGERRAV